MSKLAITLCAALAFCLIAIGCRQHSSASAAAAARVKLPASPLDQSRLLSYAQSPAFAKNVKSQAATNGWTQFSIQVRRPDSGLIEFCAFSMDTQTAVRVANLMASNLSAFAVAHKIGEVQIITPAVAPIP